jgi:ribosome-associated translation inhibitor RaiA
MADQHRVGVIPSLWRLTGTPRLSSLSRRNEGSDMAMPVHVSFHNMDRCDKLENAIFLHAGKLKTLYGGATSCRVAVIASKHRENRLKVLDVVVDLSIPGEDFVTRSHAEDEACPNASIAVADAFKRTARRLRDRRGKQLASRTRTKS